MVKSPIEHKEPITGSLDRPYRETYMSDASHYLWWAFCVLSQVFTNQAQKNITMDWNKSYEVNSSSYKVWAKKHPILTGIILVFVFIFIVQRLSGWISGSPIAKPDTSSPTPASPQTYEDRIRAIAVHTGSTDFSYMGVQDEEADKDRPAGSRMITVKVSVSSFYDKNALVKDTGKVATKMFQETFASNPKAYDVFVWYYGSTTDKYGNKKDSVIMVYAIDKDTYKKINWQNFDSAKLCDFLKSEKQASNAACNVLANIE